MVGGGRKVRPGFKARAGAPSLREKILPGKNSGVKKGREIGRFHMHGTIGRPPFKPTPSQRRRVEGMVAKGMSRSEIADVIGVGLSTLVKYFSDECKRGYATCRRDLVGCMWTVAKRGRFGAILWLEQRIREREEPAGKPLGKKAAAQLAAQSAGRGTAWEALLHPQPPPKRPPRSN